MWGMSLSQSAERLHRFFQTHPAAAAATRPLGAKAEVALSFHDDSGVPYRFFKQGDRFAVEQGAAKDPDFTLELPAAAVEELTGIESDALGEFAVAFFKLMLASEADRQVKVKLSAGLFTLTRRGYLSTLALGGPPVIAFMAKRGLVGPAGIKKALNALKR